MKFELLIAHGMIPTAKYVYTNDDNIMVSLELMPRRLGGEVEYWHNFDMDTIMNFMNLNNTNVMKIQWTFSGILDGFDEDPPRLISGMEPPAVEQEFEHMKKFVSNFPQKTIFLDPTGGTIQRNTLVS